MFYNDTTGEVKFFREGSAMTGLGPEWEDIGVATVMFTVQGVEQPYESGGPKPAHLLGRPKQ